MSLFNSEDRGIESDPSDPDVADANNNGIVDDGLGNDAAPEDVGTD